MGNLCLGMNYYQFRASRSNFKGRPSASGKITLCGATIHVVCIDPHVSPFVVGSITNGRAKNFLNSLAYPKDSPDYPLSNSREALHLKSVINIYKNEIYQDSYLPQSLLSSYRNLKPVWISNGTFFGPHVETKPTNYTHIFGPVIHEGVPIVEVPNNSLGGSKEERWYSSQPKSISEFDVDAAFKKVEIRKSLKAILYIVLRNLTESYLVEQVY